MHLLEVLNPIGQQRGLINSLTISERPQSLDNKTVGLLWSGTHGGDLALNRAGEMLQERFSNVKVNFYTGGKLPPRRLPSCSKPQRSVTSSSARQPIEGRARRGWSTT